MSRTLLALLTTAFVAAACATTSDVQVPREVLIPVPTPCKPDPKLLPDRNQTYEFSTASRSDDLHTKIRKLLIERDQRAITEAKLWAALDACRSLPSPAN